MALYELKHVHEIDIQLYLCLTQTGHLHTELVAIDNALKIVERGSKSLETVFSMAICRQSGDKRQSKTLFLTILIVHRYY